MLTKKNLWFLTLFSMIIVMSIYYVSFPTEDLKVNASTNSDEKTTVTIKESESITALRISRDETIENEMTKIKEILNDENKTSEEKSDAFEALKNLKTNKGKEDTLEKSLKEKFNYDSFVKIEGNNIKVVVDTNKHSYELANKIISSIQKEFDDNIYVSVSFKAK